MAWLHRCHCPWLCPRRSRPGPGIIHAVAHRMAGVTTLHLQSPGLQTTAAALSPWQHSAITSRTSGCSSWRAMARLRPGCPQRSSRSECPDRERRQRPRAPGLGLSPASNAADIVSPPRSAWPTADRECSGLGGRAPLSLTICATADTLAPHLQRGCRIGQRPRSTPSSCIQRRPSTR